MPRRRAPRVGSTAAQSTAEEDYAAPRRRPTRVLARRRAPEQALQVARAPPTAARPLPAAGAHVAARRGSARAAKQARSRNVTRSAPPEPPTREARVPNVDVAGAQRRGRGKTPRGALRRETRVRAARRRPSFRPQRASLCGRKCSTGLPGDRVTVSRRARRVAAQGALLARHVRRPNWRAAPSATCASTARARRRRRRRRPALNADDVPTTVSTTPPRRRRRRARVFVLRSRGASIFGDVRDVLPRALLKKGRRARETVTAEVATTVAAYRRRRVRRRASAPGARARRVSPSSCADARRLRRAYVDDIEWAEAKRWYVERGSRGARAARHAAARRTRIVSLMPPPAPSPTALGDDARTPAAAARRPALAVGAALHRGAASPRPVVSTAPPQRRPQSPHRAAARRSAKSSARADARVVLRGGDSQRSHRSMMLDSQRRAQQDACGRESATPRAADDELPDV